MKKFKILFFSVLVFSFFSCQKEELEITEQKSNPETLTATSQLANLVIRVTQNPTSGDNILDNSSCFSVVLPVTVIVNNEQIVVATASDYQLVQNAIDQFATDDDIVNFVYPITIQFQNSQTQIILNSDMLDDVIDNCGDDDGLDEIDCIQFMYPININVYDANNQFAQTIAIQTDVQFYNFIDNLSSNQIIAFQFPIAIIDSNGLSVTITSNQQLLEFIDDSIDDCNSNSGGGSGGNTDFATVLTSGSWKITYFFDDVDETTIFNSYNFVFNPNGTSIASGNQVINGTWNTYLNSGTQKLNLVFDGLTLDEIEEDWNIIEFTPTLIRLKHVSGGNGGTDYLTFTKI
jgi:hypothetical protein